jgi:hypothetical protein
VADFFCATPICGRVDVELKDVDLTNVVMHGSALGAAVPEFLLESGVRDHVESDLAGLRKRWSCTGDCACTMIEVADFEVAHTRNLINELVIPAAAASTTILGYPVGVSFAGVTFSATLDFKLHFKIWAGLCHSTDAAALVENAKRLQQALDDLRKLGVRLRAGLDPDALWKEIGGASPKALRESPSVEPPVRIRHKPATPTPGP